MDGGIKTTSGLRSRHNVDIEQGWKDGDHDNAFLDDHDIRDEHPSRFTGLVTRYIPNAPVRRAMIRCEQRCCLTRKGHHSREKLARMTNVSCCQVVCNVFRKWTIGTAVGAPAGTTANQVARTSLETLETDEETPDEWPAGSSVTVPKSPKLLDYSKRRADLPEKGSFDIEFCLDSEPETDDNSSITEEDLLLSSQGKPSEERISFALRLPKTNRRPMPRNPPVRTFSSNSLNTLRSMGRSTSTGSLRELLQNSNKDDLNTKAAFQAKANRRKRSGSGDALEVSTRNNFVAPFPRPLSRENSIERLTDLDGVKSPHHTPAQRHRTLRPKDFRGLMNSPGNCSEPEPMIDYTEETTMLLNDVSDHDTSRCVNSDDEVDPDLRARRKIRLNKRSSFVKGSKIERFDSNDPQRRARRAMQRREAVKNAESYAEWKLDLMVNG